MLLSVLMMVKDEEKNIKRCLESLNKIKNEFIHEIIIVDTGSTDNTINIIKDLARKNNKIQLYHETWNNNFSEMRNYTIALASGEWLFVIDADEEVGDAKGINKLLETNDPKHHVALIQIINYTKKDLSSYASMTSPRLFRANDDFHYEGAVHNQVKYPEPYNTVRLLGYLNHYGYFNDDIELQKTKFKRTTNILHSELKKNPEYHYYWYQLAQSYKMVGRYAEAENFINKAIKLQSQHPNYFGIQASLRLILTKYDEAIMSCYEGIKLEPEFIDLWYYMGEALRMKKDFQLAINHYNVFLDLAKSFEKLSINNKTHIVVHTLSRISEVTNKLISLTATMAMESVNKEV